MWISLQTVVLKYSLEISLIIPTLSVQSCFSILGLLGFVLGALAHSEI